MSFKILVLIVLIVAADPSRALTFLDGEDATEIPCEKDDLIHLSDQCHLLKVFNQTEVDLMSASRVNQIALKCACELMNMYKLWHVEFNGDSTLRLYSIVEKLTLKENLTHYPDFLWSDFEVTVERISIHVATKDFFDKANTKGFVRSPEARENLRNSYWILILKFCRNIAEDKYKLYRYLENLNRLDRAVFFRLVTSDEMINLVYETSKVCKILLLRRFNDYKIRPDNMDYIPVDTPDDSFFQGEEGNLVESDHDLDSMFRHAKTSLDECDKKGWSNNVSTIEDLKRDCPMMIQEKVPDEWIKRQSTLQERSDVALKCGCQLLLHNSDWEKMSNDSNIKIMANALTNYLNSNAIPNIMKTPVLLLQDWFNNAMAKFVASKKPSIKEVRLALIGEQEALAPVSKEDNSGALEVLRSGCNYIMFNYNKGFKDKTALKLIRYLDNLQNISPDPTFVFRLTLQDVNLFKLHALSKWCIPVMK